MKKYRIMLYFCVLMLVTSVLPDFTGAMFEEPIKQIPLEFVNINDPPVKMPGELIADAPVYITEPVRQKEVFHPEVSLLYQDDVIIEIIEQIDEDLYLGYLEDLVAFGPRRTGTQACWDAGDWIYDKFQAMDLEVRYHNWSYGGYSGSNIEGTLVGTDESSDDIYLICAHYDSVTGSPGADDDGSGTIAVITAAHLLSQYASNFTIRFVAFSGEEQGLLGSYKYAQEAYQNGDNIVGVLNGDMIGFAISTYDGDNIKIYENSASNWITQLTADVSDLYDEYIDLNIIPSGPSSGSDHASFWQFNYDAIFYHEYNFNDYYHSPQDTIENMNISYAVKSTRLEVATLAELGVVRIPSQAPEQPTITGPATGFINEDIQFMVQTEDPEGEDVFYYIDWGDGNVSDWYGPYGSGEPATVTYQWEYIDDYEIRVLAKDIHGVKSEWSEPHLISMLHGPILDVRVINGGLFRASTLIENDGDVPATDVAWSISLDGGALIGAESSGVIDAIPVGGSVEIATDFVLGFGPTIITAIAELDQGMKDTREQSGFVLLFFVKVNPGGG